MTSLPIDERSVSSTVYYTIVLANGWMLEGASDRCQLGLAESVDCDSVLQHSALPSKPSSLTSCGTMNTVCRRACVTGTTVRLARQLLRSRCSTCARSCTRRHLAVHNALEYCQPCDDPRAELQPVSKPSHTLAGATIKVVVC